MTTSDSPNLRIGDSEREQAIAALGEHYSAGRLDIDEYGERSAKVTAARTREDLNTVFTDLPQPHPQLSPQAATPPPPDVEVVPPSPPRHIQRRQFASAVVGLSWLGAILLIVAVHSPSLVIFIPIALSVAVGAYWGKGWREDAQRYEARARRRSRRRFE